MVRSTNGSSEIVWEMWRLGVSEILTLTPIKKQLKEVDARKKEIAAKRKEKAEGREEELKNKKNWKNWRKSQVSMKVSKKSENSKSRNEQKVWFRLVIYNSKAKAPKKSWNWATKGWIPLSNMPINSLIM